MKFFRKLVSAFTPRSMRDLEYEYLASSNDLVDLERRQRKISRGEIRFF